MQADFFLPNLMYMEGIASYRMKFAVTTVDLIFCHLR